jgi:hypothetical protein
MSKLASALFLVKPHNLCKSHYSHDSVATINFETMSHLSYSN